MITHTLSVSGTNPQLQAGFAYDGAGSRVQQVDYTGASPVTTTYVNDIVGLTQVLLADDGAEQVYNLLGLDLIGQDEGANTRYLLADGLGSVRTEMVDGDVESVATYDPYGNLLTQTGNSGTTFGYTGEQHDDATGLLYLRARYYNPALRSFMGRDPWSGDVKRPQSMNGWSYVEGNPNNFVDLTGTKRFPGHCRKLQNPLSYANCIRDYYDVDPPSGPRSIDYEINAAFRGFFRNGSALTNLEGTPGCWRGAVPYVAPGYVEGINATPLAVIGWHGTLFGAEIVYDFATMERQAFSYSTNNPETGQNGHVWGTGILGMSLGYYTGKVNGFRSWNNISDDYKGGFGFFNIGISPGPFALGGVWFKGDPDYSIHGWAGYVSIGASPEKVSLPVDISWGDTYYQIYRNSVSSHLQKRYYDSFPSSAAKVTRYRELLSDIQNNHFENLTSVFSRTYTVFDIFLPNHFIRDAIVAPMAMKYMDVYDGIHYFSYEPMFD